MKSKNIFQIAILAGLTLNGPAYGMWTSVLKKCISAAGILAGVGIPLKYSLREELMPALQGLQKTTEDEQIQYINNETQVTSRPPTPQEAAFLQSCTENKSVKFRIIPEDSYSGFLAFSHGNFVVLREKELFCDDTLAEAIEYNNEPLLEYVAGTVQHEICHIEKNHTRKKFILLGATPTILTGLASICMQKLLPINVNHSILQHVGLASLKIAGGFALKNLLTQLNNKVETHLAHRCEFEADQNIKPQNRQNFIEGLSAIDNINKQILASYSPEERKHRKAMIKKTHPSTKERAKRLGIKIEKL